MANEFRDIGRDIRNAVVDAVNSGDFSALNSRISRSVSEAIDEVNERLSGRRSGDAWNPPPNRPPEPPRPQPQPKPAGAELQCYVKQPRGRLSGILFTVFGAITLGVSGMALLGTALACTLTAAWSLRFYLSSILLALLTAGGGVMLGVGRRLSGRIDRFRRYVKAIGGRMYCPIARLAEQTGKKERYVLQDLRSMIGQGMFPHGHIDDEEKTLLLTDEVYGQYQELKRRRAEQQADEARRSAESAEERLYRETVERGESYLETIRRANDAIPGEAVSQKLYRLEEIVRKIFEQVHENPAQIPELRRFLDYYMPTTLKLVEAYQELDAQTIEGENIRRSKEEIEKTLDTINLAFENLFDSLFAHKAVDISSDIAVLKTLLRQEGLTDKDFVTESD